MLRLKKIPTLSAGSLFRFYHKKILWLLALLLLASGAGAADIVLAFSEAHAPSASLDGAARIQLITGQLQRMGVPPGVVLVRTGERHHKNLHWLDRWMAAAYLPVNHGHHFHLLGRPDTRWRSADVHRASRQLMSLPGWRQHIYLPGVDTASLVKARRWNPLAVSLRLDTGQLDLLYRQNSHRFRQLAMDALQQDVLAELLQPLQAMVLARQGIDPHAPLVLQLSADDVTAYLLPGLVDGLLEKGFRLVTADRLFLPPVSASPLADLRQPDRYLAALLNLSQKRTAYPPVVDTASLVTDPARYGFNSR